MDIEEAFQPDPINSVIGSIAAEENDELQEFILKLTEEAGITGDDSSLIAALLLRAFFAGCAWAIVKDESESEGVKSNPEEGLQLDVRPHYWIDEQGLWHITLSPEAAMLVLSFSLEGGFSQ